MSKKVTTVVPRICYLTEAFYPPSIGGLEKHAYQIADRLTSEGLELFVITRQTEPPSADFERVGNILVKRISPAGQWKGKGWKALSPILSLLIRIFYLLIKNADRYDIIMVSGLKILPIPAVLVSMIAHKKCIIKVESPTELWEGISAESLRKMILYPASVLLKLWLGIRNALIKKVDCIVAISPEIRRELISIIRVDPQKICSIPNGIDIDKFYPVSSNEMLKIRQKLSLPTDKVILTFAGRLTVSKGLLLLIQIWRELVQKYKCIHLLLVGSGKDSFDSCEDEIRDYIKVHKLEQSVSLAGSVDNVYEYLQASDAFVFPSDYEGFGLALVEALACGLPTVTTRVGVASELIQNHHNGILINPKNHQELQAAIEWLLNHKDRWAAMGENARKGVVEKYSIEAVSKKYLEMFMELQRNEKGSIQIPNKRVKTT